MTAAETNDMITIMSILLERYIDMQHFLDFGVNDRDHIFVRFGKDTWQLACLKNDGKVLGTNALNILRDAVDFTHTDETRQTEREEKIDIKTPTLKSPPSPVDNEYSPEWHAWLSRQPADVQIETLKAISLQSHDEKSVVTEKPCLLIQKSSPPPQQGVATNLGGQARGSGRTIMVGL